MNAQERADAALNRLCKWRTFFAGWHRGTQPDSDGPTRAIRNEVDARFEATDDGLKIDAARATGTMRSLGFPP